MIDGAKQTLKQYFGYDSFRPGQERMVSAILSGEDALGVMPTGAGKSICYQVPALMLQGLTLVISPLVSLMGDQVRALKEVGARPSYLNSSLTPAQQNTVLKRASEGWYQIRGARASVRSSIRRIRPAPGPARWIGPAPDRGR